MSDSFTPQVAIIGGGPAGLMAAEVLSSAGVQVDVYDAMPSLGRKFLQAGVGGMNITHSEAFDTFCTRYGPPQAQAQLQAALEQLPPTALRAWVHGLGIDTFVGSSGRVFPTEMKAAPLLRAWLHRLRSDGVRLHVRHRGGYLDRLFCASEMLDWEAPTGGYLLTACFASGKQAGSGVLEWLSQQEKN
ncbi:NAD(P)-binding protein [Undibacterium piscinae]|uniref:NAD(P)-binding protein n=1 Tax=Undibacterium piscinae TaxID=2495591 RepID=A0A6M4A608_9BURK|nr:NAD(P)-binding protein [Undibacterium piscinae]